VLREKKTPSGVVAAGGVKNGDHSETNQSRSESQSFTLIQLTPRDKFQGWRKIYGRIAVGERDGEIFINPGILGPWAGLCAIIDQVAVCVQNEPLFVPISWAIREYPRHAKDLRKLISHVERALREEDSK
jgi:hypothetical protein